MSESRIASDISEDEITEMRKDIRQLAIRLRPFLIALEADDKKVLTKIGNKNIPFIARVLQYTETHRQTAETGEFKSEAELISALRELKHLLKTDDSANNPFFACDNSVKINAVKREAENLCIELDRCFKMQNAAG